MPAVTLFMSSAPIGPLRALCLRLRAQHDENWASSSDQGGNWLSGRSKAVLVGELPSRPHKGGGSWETIKVSLSCLQWGERRARESFLMSSTGHRRHSFENTA